jgi:hypothetical protein
MEIEKLRIEELSVGDWVRHTFYEENVQIVRIYGDSERVLAERGKMSISCHLNHFEPIPITAEILEKNGLMRVTEEKGYEAYCCNDFLIRRSKFSCTDWWQVDVHYKQYVAHLSGYIQYVHQLQHLLTINECDKKIEL